MERRRKREAVRKQHRCTENDEKCGRKQEKAANEGFTICTEMEPFSLELRWIHKRSFSSCNAENSWSHFLCLALEAVCGCWCDRTNLCLLGDINL